MLPLTRNRFLAAMTVTIVMSIVVPVAIVGWFAVSAFSGKPIGDVAAEVKYFPGVVKNGEMWFWVRRYLGNPFRPNYDFRLKRMNMETGVESETGITPTVRPMNPFWIGEELFAYQTGGIYQLAGSSFVDFAPLPTSMPGFFSYPFLYEDHLSTIVESANGKKWLVQFIDGEWTNGREVRLPGPINENRGNIEFDAHDLFDFRFTDAAFAAPAITIEDAAINETRDKTIPFAAINGRYFWLTRDRNGPLAVRKVHPFRVARQSADGHWSDLESYDGEKTQYPPDILVDCSGDRTYLVESHPWFDMAIVHHIDGNIVRPAHLSLDGYIPEYITRWKWFSIGSLVAWLMHCAIPIEGVRGLGKAKSDSRYHFGRQVVTIASVALRGVAFVADLLLMLLTVVLLGFIESQIWGAPWRLWSAEAICDVLFELELSVKELIDGSFVFGTSSLLDRSQNVLQMSAKAVLPERADQPKFFLTGLLAFLGLCLLKVSLESRYGITPGKWLIGIRVMRSTLRPCGFARSLVRNLLYWVDVPCFLTPLPAAISMMLSPKCQRLGDRVADTIVVNANSIRR